METKTFATAEVKRKCFTCVHQLRNPHRCVHHLPDGMIFFSPIHQVRTVNLGYKLTGARQSIQICIASRVNLILLATPTT